jgi:ATP-dependent helicase HepA
VSNRFQPGQRWISVSEPELGLGEVRAVDARTVTVSFRAAKETRQYTAANAPLRRAAFRAGDNIRLASGDRADIVVEAVVERGGVLYYQAGGREVRETALSDTLSFSSPLTRLFATQFDPPRVFDLRLAALRYQHAHRRSTTHGFVGGRIDLLPHQLSIVSEVTGRLTPRVLFADDVGLGKTIEACLVLHRLILTGRTRRVLVAVPESLVHQWLVELLRRFNLWFHIYDEGRCAAVEEAGPGANPFLEHQRILCDVGLLTRNGRRLTQALDAGWDVIVVDEAHHLRWSPDGASPEYAAVEALGRQTPGLLLLTATPEQLGVVGHFARLRLLDPDRFSDLEAFRREAADYRAVARLIGRVADGLPLATPDVENLAQLLAEPATAVRATLDRIANGDAAARRRLIDDLLDRHGTGRVMFRNTRATVGGFPPRVPHLHVLEPSAAGTRTIAALAQEWLADEDLQRRADFRPNYARDPRLDWLAAFLREARDDKVLLICNSPRKALAIDAALETRLTLKSGVFHEGMPLVQRDRSAAWFAEPGGAQLLICSEIGSEGRNFQFAHHLVLFDLPIDPGLLEQRIGRLDRIGQVAPVDIHVPFVPGTPQEIIVRWHHEGLNALAQTRQGGQELLERFDTRVRELAARAGGTRRAAAAEVADLIASVRQACAEVEQKLEDGRDRLLEWNSFRPEVSAPLIDEIRRQDADTSLESFMLAVFDHYFIEVEELAPRTYRLGSAGVLNDTFPGLTASGLTLTADRRRALAREDLQFLTWDHPLVTGAMDRLLGSEHGNCTFARWVDGAASGLYVDAVYVLECIAPPFFHADRFLPPTPIRAVVDHRGRDAAGAMPADALFPALGSGQGRVLLSRPDVRDVLLPRLIERGRALAESAALEVVARARRAMRDRLSLETSRLRHLQRVNRSVREEEIEALTRHQAALEQFIGAARLRLDALRIVHRGPEPRITG